MEYDPQNVDAWLREKDAAAQGGDHARAKKLEDLTNAAIDLHTILDHVGIGGNHDASKARTLEQIRKIRASEEPTLLGKPTETWLKDQVREAIRVNRSLIDKMTAPPTRPESSFTRASLRNIKEPLPFLRRWKLKRLKTKKPLKESGSGKRPHEGSFAYTISPW